jgi:GNAT superfamily N-acetyltransferase
VFDDARSFREVADPLLLENEPANNLILGISGNAMGRPGVFEGFSGWVVVESGHAQAAAVRTPPHNLVVGLARSEEAITELAGAVGEIPGVVACLPWVETFVAARKEPMRRVMSQGVFALSEVTTPPPSPGLSRPGRAHELDVIMEMRIAFEQEAIGHVEDPESTRQGTVARLEEQSAGFGLWVKEAGGEIVSISGHGGPTPHGIRIGPVYTPPEHRGRGFASSLVAAQSQWLLDSGRRFCFLYTDLANATSNSIYQRIGYRQIAESAQYDVDPGSGTVH